MKEAFHSKHKCPRCGHEQTTDVTIVKHGIKLY